LKTLKENRLNLTLPIWKLKNQIIALLGENKFILRTPPGTGKTTQVPQLLHELGYTSEGAVIITVPTQVLAIELSARVAFEMGVKLGALVGYQIRGKRVATRGTKILFMTDGVLRGMLRRDPLLNGVRWVLLDEYHMRKRMQEFNASMLEKAQAEGSKCGMVIMSATIDCGRLADFFNCAILDGEGIGTTFSYTKTYAKEDIPDHKKPEATAERVEQRIVSGKKGNIQVFVPGVAQLEATIDAINKRLIPGLTVLPLHSQLEDEERHAPFVVRPGITCTVHTDIVETGATLPGTMRVIDWGLANELEYDTLSDVSAVRTVRVSKSRLRQREGRCCRIAEGGEYDALFTEEDYNSRPQDSLPEIACSPLRDTVLYIKSCGLTREKSPLRFLDNPSKAAWVLAKRQLQQCGMVDQTAEAPIVERGEQAILIGCDPREAAMLFAAAENGCIQEMAIAISAIQGKPLFFRVKNEDEEILAKQARYKFLCGKLCDAWTPVQIVRQAMNRAEGTSLGQWCRENYISFLAMRDLLNNTGQLIREMGHLGYPENDEPGTETALARCIAAGLQDRVFEYTGRRSNYSLSIEGQDDLVAGLGRESLLSLTHQRLAVWGIHQVPNGSLYINNAVAIPEAA
jgi:HrpA-like RNA helicase